MAKFIKSGLVSAALHNEIHQEPDGSLWVPVFVHCNPTNQKFTSSDTFSTGVFHNDTMWLNFNICKVLSSWEFLAVQASTDNSTPFKLRWTQTKSPFNASYSDVTPSAVTRNTTSGYTDAGTSGGGWYVANGSTYIITANSTSGNWWGAVGSWTAFQGGIPGFNGQVCSTGYMLGYIRITTTQLKLLQTPDIILSSEIMEY